MPRLSHFLRSSTSMSRPASFATARASWATIVGVILLAGSLAIRRARFTASPTASPRRIASRTFPSTTMLTVASGEALADGALAAGQGLRGLLVVEQRDDADVGGGGVGRLDGAELHSLSPLLVRAPWIARRRCSWLVAGSWMRTRSSPTRRVRP